MQAMQHLDQGPEFDELNEALAGLGFLAEDALRAPRNSEALEAAFLEKRAQAIDDLRATFGWDARGRVTENTARAIRAQVAALQRKLAALDCYKGTADGRFGEATRQALRRFQETDPGRRLAPTGVMDPATRDALLGLPPYTFDEVLCSELDAVNHAREAAGMHVKVEAAGSGNALVRAHQTRLMGLAFSGGGIRSATFNLGVLQALARLGLLHRVDYLSTVSGGGYIGSWLHAWVKREGGVGAVERKLAVEAGAAAHEPGQVTWLRQYSNYLTPRVGLLSGDTMAGVATWLRNVLLNQAILGALGLLLLSLPWLLLMMGHMPWWRDGLPSVATSAVGAVLLLTAIILSARETAAIQQGATAKHAGDNPRRHRTAIASAVAAALLLGVAAPYAIQQYLAPGLGEALGLDQAVGRLWLVAMGPPAVILGLLLLITLLIGAAGRGLREASREWWSRTGGILISVMLGWLALAVVALLGSYGLLYAGAWITAMGGIIWLATTVAGVVLARSPATGEGKAGWKDALTAVAPWVFVAGLMVLLSFALHWTFVQVGGPGRMAVCTPVPDTSVASLRSAYRLNLEMTPDGHAAAGEILRVEADPGCSLARYAVEADQALAGSRTFFAALMAALAALALWLGRRVDINVFAFHMFYRNRLERCYMGASNPKRQANPFTGLDPTDSPRLDELRDSDGRVQRPYPLINTALNITRSDNLAWQERKAASFLFTPEHCGYQFPGTADAGVAAYQKTGRYLEAMSGDKPGWLALGTPVTISGAAASPNAGYHTNPAAAFLMTVFNVRLGWWMQNTRQVSHWTEPGPRQSIPYLLKELLASTSDTDEFVYLSDGGHFENLGIYELVRRRCRYIIACDAGCDPDYSFEDLGNAIRKCRIDLGIDIDIDPGAIRPDPATGLSPFHCAVGTIHYEYRDPVATPGYLLYIKASLTGNEPPDVKQYKADHGAFPHESTGDQWYSESQFESYRALGRHVAMQVLSEARDDAARRFRSSSQGSAAEGDAPCDQELLFHALSERWYPPSAVGRTSFSKHGAELEKIYDRMRQDGHLRFLDGQIYPEWARLSDRVQQDPAQQQQPTMLPPSGDELRAGFYLCNTLIQLMENVYTDLRLEEEYAHPDNRGWMNLFRHWSWSGMFRVTWSICVATYGAHFQQFCRRHLDLESGTLSLASPIEVGSPQWMERINFLELEHVHRIILGHFVIKSGEGPTTLAPEAAAALVYPVQDRLARLCDEWIDTTSRTRFELRPLEMRVSDPFGKEADFVFPVGFALLKIPMEKKETPLPYGLVYYRIQDHLRRMGLGREGLHKLREAYDKLYVDMPADLQDIIPEADPALLQNLWHLVLWASPDGDGKDGRKA